MLLSCPDFAQINDETSMVGNIKILMIASHNTFNLSLGKDIFKKLFTISSEIVALKSKATFLSKCISVIQICVTIFYR